MSKSTHDHAGDESAAPRPDRRPLLLAGGFVALGLAAAVMLLGGSSGDGPQAAGLQSIPAYSDETTVADAGAFPALLEAGQPAPNFELLAAAGDSVSLADYAGRPVLLNFWATWCPPCRLEMPDLEQASRDYADDGLVVLAINQGETAKQVTSFAEELGLTFPMLVDQDGRVGTVYGAEYLPTSYFIDAEGTVTAVHRGSLTRSQLDEYLSATIARAGS